MIGTLKKLFKKEKSNLENKEREAMKKVLYITANPKEESQSYSLEAGRKFLDLYKSQNPQDEIVELDLYNLDIPFIDDDVFKGWGKLGAGVAFEELSETEKFKVGAINTYTEQFIDADKYIFVTPMWNLSLPPKVKVYVDTLMIAGKTFHYTEQGPEGLLKDKKAFHIHATGGVYSNPTLEHMEFGNSYLKTVLGFMGVNDFNSVLLEGTAMAGDDPSLIKNKAIDEINEKVVTF